MMITKTMGIIIIIIITSFALYSHAWNIVRYKPTCDLVTCNVLRVTFSRNSDHHEKRTAPQIFAMFLASSTFKKSPPTPALRRAQHVRGTSKRLSAMRKITLMKIKFTIRIWILMWILLSRPDAGWMSLHLHLHLTEMTHMTVLITYYQPRTIYLLIIIGNKNWLLIIIIHHTGEKYWSPSLWKILIISIIICIIYLIITEHYPDTLLSWCYGNQMGRRYHSTKTENQFVAILHLMKGCGPCDS